MFDFLFKEKSGNPPRNKSFLNDNYVAFVICCIVFMFWFYFFCQKYYHFGYYDWDLALYNQAILKLSQGSFYSHLWGMNFLANHSEYISFFLVPIYKLAPHPLTLIFLKLLSTVAGSYILYLLARKYLPFTQSIILMLLYLFYPANIFGLLYEFHIESLSVFFIFLLFFFYQQERYWAFIITCVLTSLIKENLPLIIIMFGVYGLWERDSFKKKLKWGVWPILIGLTVFITAIFIITPYLRKDFPTSNQYISAYSNLGVTPTGILSTLLFHPIKLFQLIFTPKNIHLLNELLVPLLFLPLFKLPILLIALPIFLQHFLSSAATEHTIYFHYTATLTPFLFVAALEKMKHIQNNYNKKFQNIIYCLLISVGFVNFVHYKDPYSIRILFYSDAESRQLWKLVNQIPQDKGVISTLRFLSPLSNHQTVESFLDVVNQSHGLSFKKYHLSDDITYALIDYDDLWVASKIRNYPETSLPRIKEFFDIGWKAQDSFNRTVLYERILKK